jgi:hypothetical protein
MAEEEEVPDTHDKAVRGWIVAVGFTLVLVGGEMMAERAARFVLGAFILLLALPVYLSAAWWKIVREKLSTEQVSTLRLVANDAHWWFGLFFILIISLAISPAARGLLNAESESGTAHWLF